jgi:hypothetical protein
LAAVAERGVPAPRAIGVTESLPDHDEAAQTAELTAFLEQ